MTSAERLLWKNIAVQGFRSTFRDWASDQTSFSYETCEHAQAHWISDKAEAAYRRGDQFEKRRKLMEAWAGFYEPAAQRNVIDLNGTKGWQFTSLRGTRTLRLVHTGITTS